LQGTTDRRPVLGVPVCSVIGLTHLSKSCGLPVGKNDFQGRELYLHKESVARQLRNMKSKSRVTGPGF